MSNMRIQESMLRRLSLSPEVGELLRRSKKAVMPETRNDLIEIALGGKDVFNVSYPVPGKGDFVEAVVVRCKNGIGVNYTEEYMRRRDPDCMVIGDEGETDKIRFEDRFGPSFDGLRNDTLEWLSQQDLLVLPFMSGRDDMGYPSLLIAPDNAGFFAAGLADLQGFIPASRVPDGFTPQAVVFVAPPFRHSVFDGQQVVVHRRTAGVHEIYSYNLYPGPSAKKGIYGVLLTIGEQEGWTTLHGATVKVITPYENQLTIMHEGASGGGKSEMIEQLHREPDGRLLVGENLKTEEKYYLEMADSCELRPITDDMAFCPTSLQNGSGKLVVVDAEEGWFLRVNHITKYGTDPHYERLCTHPPEPLVFLNMQAVPGATCLIWEHTMDAPGRPCPNPRVIMPRHFVPGIINDPVEVDMRSFGIRVPPCTREKPSYGILGLFHNLSPALGWLWRLVAPRGHANPSITDSEGMTSEGVGSYWPFATGTMVDQANLLLEQIIATPKTRYKLIPNQHIGAYRVGFMPQWLAREYLSRRGSVQFRPEQIVPARCPLLGHVPKTVKIDGTLLPKGFLQVETQPEVGEEAYDAGAAILTTFFRQELKKYLSPDLQARGREIIECCLDNGTVEDYAALLPEA